MNSYDFMIASKPLTLQRLLTDRFNYRFSLKWNWNRLLVIFAPLWPLNTNMDSRATATGKLQQVGGQSPDWTTSSQILASPGNKDMVHMSLSRTFPS